MLSVGDLFGCHLCERCHIQPGTLVRTETLPGQPTATANNNSNNGGEAIAVKENRDNRPGHSSRLFMLLAVRDMYKSNRAGDKQLPCDGWLWGRVHG
jgi:hypothetical protein